MPSPSGGTININTSNLGNALSDLLTSPEIIPGDEPSYQLCKTIYAFHPLGAKMAEAPISMAQSQQRDISIPKGPEDRLKESFTAQWTKDYCDRHIFNTMRLARIYGISSVALLVKGLKTNKPADYKKLWDADISFNCFDPLNTAGSLFLNQNPNAMDFQKTQNIRVAGEDYHRSRAVIMLNEDPLYIEYTNSAFGFVGRSVYQRALYPLRSFVRSMVTDDMIVTKAGLLIAKMKPVGSIIDNVMQVMAGIKRTLLQQGVTGNILSIDVEEEIETLNMQNLDGAYTVGRTNLLKNIATAADMPAKLLENETMVSGFGEGTEDAKNIARYVDRVRVQMQPLYEFFDKITMYRAWNPEYYKTIQNDFSDTYKGVPYERAFYDWSNSFQASWPSLLKEPPSEEIQVDDVKLKAIIAQLEVLLPIMDPENKVRLIQWACDGFNELKLMFGSHLVLDWEALRDYKPEEAMPEQHAPPPFSARDSQDMLYHDFARGKGRNGTGGMRKGMAAYSDAVAKLVEHLDGKQRAGLSAILRDAGRKSN